MSDPTVAGVMLVNGRHDMASRAVQTFMAQTYTNKYLILWDSGEPKYAPPFVYDPHGIQIWHRRVQKSIGMLRNEANAEAKADVIIHFDSDDYSHPNRIAEQVAMLQASGAECVGYREMLFWREPQLVHTSDDYDELGAGFVAGEAWLYTDAYRPVGTSLCYWRRTWEHHPFPDLPQPHRQPNPDMRGEDVEWLRGMNFKAVELACGAYHTQAPEAGSWIRVDRSEPRMIARIHGGNSSGSYAELGKSVWWRRVPEWDAYCRERMTL